MKAKAVSKKRTKVIQVTQRDIDLGDAREADTCPVARALSRSFHKKVGTFSVTSCISRLYPYKRLSYTPKGVLPFIRRFDNNLPVVPFSFELVY